MRRLVFAPRSLAAVAIAAGLCSLAFVLASPVQAQDDAHQEGEREPSDAAPAETPPEKPAPPVRRVGEVSITAARAERNVLDVPGNVTVIDRERIDESGARDVPELLRREAGLYVTNDIGNPEGYRVEARGFNNGGGNGSSLLVLLDGRRINEADSSFIDWSLVHLDRVERIEISRGPANALYGDNATAGVIEITTKDGKGEPVVTLATHGGSYDSLAGSLFAGGTHGIFGGALYVDGSTTAGYRDRSDFDAHTFNGRLRVTPTEKASFEVQSGYSSDDRDRPGTLTKDEIREIGREEEEPFFRRFASSHERFVQGRGDVILADGVTLTLAPYWRSRRDDGAFNDTSPFGSTFDFETDSRSFGGNAQVEAAMPIGPFANRAIAGVELLREETHRAAFSASLFGDFEATTDVDRRIWALFVQDELSITDDWILSAGVRYDDSHYEGENPSSFAGFENPTLELRDSRGIWSPRASLTWRFHETSSAYASYSRGFRLPDFDEALGFTGDLFDLRPQRSNAYEVGWKHRSDRVSANVALYWMDVEEEIFFNPYVRDFQFGFLSPQNVNLDEVRHRGIEASVNWQALDRLEVYASYTLDDAQVREDRIPGSNLAGAQLPITPLHRGTVGAISKLPYGFETGFNVNVVGERPVANDLAGADDELDPYVTVDTTFAWRHSFGERFDVALLFRVLNLIDENYEEFAGAPTFGVGETGFYPAPGRRYEAGFTLTWNP